MRPLIIKVDDHKVESNNKVVGSIDLNLITSSNIENSTSEEEQYPNKDDIKNDEGLTSSSLVRNLINKYENPKNHNLLKGKSKSMVDLQKPKVPIAPTTQDDSLYNRSQYDNNKEEKFDFKKVLTMFQSIDKSVPVNNSNPKPSKIFNSTKKGDIKLNNFDVGMIKQRATILLHNKPNFESFNEGSYWQTQVLELLEQICGVQPSNTIASTFSSSKKFKYEGNKRELTDETFIYSHRGEDSGIDETDLKKFEMETEPIRSSSVKDIKKYFESDLTEKYIPYKEYTKQESEEYEEELDYSSDSTDSFNTVQTASPTNSLNRMNDKEIHEFDLENLKSLVDDLIDEVRHYEEVINKMTRDDTEEFAEMNDSLYNILLKLENIRAYGDEELLNKRKDAIEFVQTCTSKLRAKLKN